LEARIVALTGGTCRQNRKRAHMNVLIGVLITFLVVFLVLYLVDRLPIEGNAKQIVRVIIIIIGILALLRYLAVF
jgi:hypothetical protein